MLRDVLSHYSHTLASVATLLPVWCWWWRNKEGAAAAAAAVVVVVVLESCHQQRGQHHQQQRPEPAPRCSRSCGISSSTDVGSWKSSLPSSAITSRTGRPWGPRQETSVQKMLPTLSTIYDIAVLLLISGVREWCGLVWVASVSVSVMQASVKSLSLGLLLLSARCWPQITTESEHLRHSAALPGECS